MSGCGVASCGSLCSRLKSEPVHSALPPSLLGKECWCVKKVTRITSKLVTVVGGRLPRSFSGSEQALMRRHPSVGQCAHLSLAPAGQTGHDSLTLNGQPLECHGSAKLRLLVFSLGPRLGSDCYFFIFTQDPVKSAMKFKGALLRGNNHD